MTDEIDQLNLYRPKLLSRAARLGIASYEREKHLKRALRAGHLPAPKAAVRRLIEAEAALDEQRKAGIATYRIERHVEVLIALLAEYRSALCDRNQTT